MSPAQWTRLEACFEQGADQPQAVRDRILVECADDPQVQTELARMWRAEADAQQFLSQPIDLEQYLTRRVLLPPGSIIEGRFTILEVLGMGGMGEVYRARDERLQRIVAIKILSSQLSADADFKNRLEREARSVSSLSHPAICSLHDLGSDGELLYLVMEFVPGETLEVRLRRGPMSRAEATSIALEICGALQHAHASGLVHRDLKPANVMVGLHGVKLLDFGIACRVGEAAAQDQLSTLGRESGLTAAGQIIGTPEYMSPEQAKGDPVDARSDIYSLGRLLLDLWEPGKIRFAVGNGRSPFSEIVQRCLQTDPSHRFSSVADLAEAIRQASRPRLLRRWAVAIVLPVVLCAWLFWPWKAPPSVPEEPTIQVLTAYPGTEYFPTLSPDGRNLAFLWNGQEENYDLYVRPLDSDSPRRLTSDPAPERSPRWSPDGRWIAFERNGKIFRMAPSGGAEEFVTEIDHARGVDCDVRLAWSPDSKRIVFSRKEGPGQQVSLHDIEVATTRVRRLTHPTGPGMAHVCPEVAPNGRRIVFRSLDAGQPKLMLADLDGGQRPLAARHLSWVDGWSYTWTLDSKDLIFSRRLPGASFLFRTPVDYANTPQRLSFGEEGMYPVVSRKGSRLVYMRRRLDLDIWKAGIPAPNPSRSLRIERFVSSSLPDSSPEYSPDGSRLAFFSERGGKRELWVSGSDGLQPIRLALADTHGAPPRWSPDGKYVVFTFDRRVHRVASFGGQSGRANLSGNRGGGRSELFP